MLGAQQVTLTGEILETSGNDHGWEVCGAGGGGLKFLPGSASLSGSLLAPWPLQGGEGPLPCASTTMVSCFTDPKSAELKTVS